METFNTYDNLYYISCHPDGTYIYVTGSRDEIAIIDTELMQVVYEIEYCDTNFSSCNLSGDKVYATSSIYNELYQIE